MVEVLVMGSRSETIVLRDATAVYLEGEIEAYEQALKRLDRDRPGPISGTPSDWFDWYRYVRADFAKLIEHTKNNLALAHAAERQREES